MPPVQEKRKNQHRPCPPDHILRPIVERLYATGMLQPEMLRVMKEGNLYDTTMYGLSERSLKTRCKEWGLLGTKSFHHTVDTAAPHIEAVRSRFNRMGLKLMKQTILDECKQKIPIPIISEYMRLHHPEEVEMRKNKRFKRKRFYAAGINDFWVFDQHDKFRRFHLYFHVGLEPVSGKILWLRVWWTNRNPRLIASYFLDVVEGLGGAPLITQSDLGTENHGIANAQTTIRQTLDPRLAGSLQHRWMQHHMNVKPEALWSQFRRQWAYAFEDILEEGVDTGRYDSSTTLDKHVLHWVFIPWLQSELDRFVARYNTTKKRYNKNSLLPHGQPDIIFNHPAVYNTRDYRVAVSPELVADVRQKYAPPDHPVFQLVPPYFGTLASQFYAELGEPVITKDSVWDIYSDILLCFQRIQTSDAQLAAELELSSLSPPIDKNPDNDMDVLPYPPFRMGDRVIGDVPSWAESQKNAGRQTPQAMDRGDEQEEDTLEGYSEDGDPADRLACWWSEDEESSGESEIELDRAA